MKITLIIGFFHALQVVISEKLDCECGKPSDASIDVRIVGGRRAAPHSFPWTVAILKNNEMHCGGALITNKHVLSAGHCFKWDDHKNLEVLIGLDNFNELDNVLKRNIDSVVIHEDFTSNPVRDENDISVATLDKIVQFNDNVRPVCLPKSRQSFADSIGVIVGWGRIGVHKTASKVLLRASLRIFPYEDCQKSHLAHQLRPTMMCAYSKGKDGCQGDSGGPLVVLQPDGAYVQAGIVSWGIGCADPKYPGVYTNVTSYLKWIHKYSADGDTCDK